MAAPLPERKILISVDQSEASSYAFTWVVKFLHRPGDKVFILHVGTVIDLGFLIEPAILNEIEQREEDRRNATVDHFVQRATDEGIACSPLVEEGDARLIICQKVDELDIDVLVLGSRGLGTIKRAWLGSVSDYCLHHSSCPTLIVRKPEDGQPVPDNHHPRKVVVAVDDSDGSAYTFNWAMEQIARPSDQIVALHVRPPAYLRYPVAEMGMGEYFMPPDSIAAIERTSARSAEGLVRKFVVQATDEYKLSCEGFVFRGEARDLLCEESTRLEADLLVIGSRGLGAVGRALLGSVSDYCAHHSTCPVLVVKPPSSGFPPQAESRATEQQ